jgi:3-hydroxybutyryl-CoA dehydratase
MNRYVWSDLHVGMTARFDAVVTEAMMATFRELSGDVNPLHSDPEFAARRGHRSPVVFGLLAASFYSTLVGVHLPGELGMLHGIDIDFHRPVYAGDRLEVSGEIKFLSDAVRRVEIAAVIRDTAGNRLSRAKIRAGLHEH